MVSFAIEAAAGARFSQSQLRLESLDIVKGSVYVGEGIYAAIAKGRHRSVSASLSGGILTHEEESR